MKRRTARQLERQFRAYSLSVVEGKTVRQIAAELGCAQTTVVLDIRHEGERRADALGDQRPTLIAKSVARYEGVIAEARRKSQLANAIAAKVLKGGRDAPRSVNDRSLDTIVRAQERIDRILGLETILKADSAMEELLKALAPKE